MKLASACGTLAAATLLLACSGGGSNASTPAPSAAASPAPTPAAEEAGRDLSSLDLCARVPAEEVAAALGGKVTAPAHGSGGAQAVDCWYSIAPAGSKSGLGKVFIAYVFPPKMYRLARSLHEEVEEVSGLGDEAYAVREEPEGEIDLQVLKRGDYSLEVKGDEREAVEKVAATIVGRL